MTTSGGRRHRSIAEINITPLTDVFLVLLVIVMLAAPVSSDSNREIVAPDVRDGADLDRGWPVIEVDKEGMLYLEGRQIPETALEARLTDLLPTLDEKNIVLRGDRSTKSGLVLRVLRTAKAVGFEQAYIEGQVPQAAVAP